MSWFKSSLRQKRYANLRADGFMAYEARPLSKLPWNTPALKAMRSARVSYLHRFQNRAKREGWKLGRAKMEYQKAVRRIYKRHDWNVQYGPQGKQKGPIAGRPNPWSMYRSYDKAAPPPKEQESPWRKKKYKHRKVSINPLRDLVNRKKKPDGEK